MCIRKKASPIAKKLRTKLILRRNIFGYWPSRGISANASVYYYSVLCLGICVDFKWSRTNKNSLQFLSCLRFHLLWKSSELLVSYFHPYLFALLSQASSWTKALFIKVSLISMPYRLHWLVNECQLFNILCQGCICICWHIRISCVSSWSLRYAQGRSMTARFAVIYLFFLVSLPGISKTINLSLPPSLPPSPRWQWAVPPDDGQRKCPGRFFQRFLHK